MRSTSIFRYVYFSHIVLLIGILAPCLVCRESSGQMIRCADPKCSLCLSVEGTTPPNQSDSREPRNYPHDAPFGRVASLAVVNPIIRSPHQSVVSLRGDWEFVTDPQGVGKNENWMQPGKKWTNSRTMPVPGNWESHGVGEPGMSTPWICSWDNNARPFRHIYIGSAWYRKTFIVPKEWHGKRVYLKLGGVRAQGWFWVNGHETAKIAQYCGSFRYDITDLVTPGEEATVVGLIRNDVPSRTGLMAACHTWGGIHRDIEIEAVPDVHLANVECFGNFDTKSVKVRFEIANTKKIGNENPTLKIDIKTLDPNDPVKPLKTIASVTKKIELRNDNNIVTETFQEIALPELTPWSPESPRLYLAEVFLCEKDGNTIKHGWCERFGVKKFEVRGKRFYLNDKPYFLRGYGDDFVYPETFISPIDRDVHRRNLKIAKDAGFVFVRHHTHSEIPEYYDAADELGVMVQAELPYYPFGGYHATELFDFDPKRDLCEVIDHYRRHISMSVYSMGNEGHLGTPLDNELKMLVHERDPGRLVNHNDGGVITEENSDFATPNVCNVLDPTTSIVPWTPGTFDHLQMPFIAHEYMNLGLKFDPRISERFTGAIMPPRPLDRYEKRLDAIGLDRHWADACLDAGHALQKHYQKLGIESARLDPECDGYSYWTLIDVIVNFGGEDNFTGQGMFNPFHEPKSNGTTPKDVAKFNGPTALLMKSDREHSILVEGEKVRLSIWISHFGYENLKNADVVWTLQDGTKILHSGKIENLNANTGDVREIGVAEFTVPKQASAQSLVFSVRIDGTQIMNDWTFWTFPQRKLKAVKEIAVTPDLYEKLTTRYSGLVHAGTPEAKDAQIVLGSATHPATHKALADGKRVMLLGDAVGPPNVNLGWWWIGDQVGTAFAKGHPAFGDFPHDGYINPLWFRLIKRGVPINTQMPLGKLEFLAVGEGRNDYFLYAGQAQTENGGKVLATYGLDLLADTPEGAYLLDRMIEYAGSEKFRPETKIDLTQLLEEMRYRDIAFSELNGWRRTISSPLQYTGDSYMIGHGTMRYMRFDTPGEVIWETQVVQEATNDDKTYTFYWLFGVGFVPDRKLNVQLLLNDEELIPFTANVADRTWEIKSGDVELKYRRLAFVGNESTGVMELTLPRKRLTPGQTAQLKISCKNEGLADSWVGILENK